MKNKYTWDIVLVTEGRFAVIKELTPFVENLVKEEQILKDEIEKHNLRVHRVDWADPDFDWTTTKVAIIRSTWDYFRRFEEFDQWLDRVQDQCIILNPVELIRWNCDKNYLKDLLNKGIHIPPTLFIAAESKESLTHYLSLSEWPGAVLKPNISGAGRHTYKIDANNVSDHEAVFAELINNEGMILQEFQNSVPERGEVSFMVFNGKYTHAIMKKAKQGDFRVQDDFGGQTSWYVSSMEEIEFAEMVMGVIQPTPLYGRVDVIWDNSGEMAVSEIEIIEPELWFRYYPEAGKILIDTIVDRYF